MDNPSLTPVEMVALAGAVKDKQLTDAKRSLPDGFAEQVDFSVHITGAIQKGTGSPEATVTRPATVSLMSMVAFCAALRILKITPKRLRVALSQLPPVNLLKPDSELAAVFDEAAAEQASALPPVTSTTPATSGRVQSQITAERLNHAQLTPAPSAPPDREADETELQGVVPDAGVERSGRTPRPAARSMPVLRIMSEE